MKSLSKETRKINFKRKRSNEIMKKNYKMFFDENSRGL
jgi:hypothetical protein